MRYATIYRGEVDYTLGISRFVQLSVIGISYFRLINTDHWQKTISHRASCDWKTSHQRIHFGNRRITFCQYFIAYCYHLLQYLNVIWIA